VNLKAELEIRELHNRLEDIEAMLVRGFSRGGNGKRSTSQLSAGDIE
jgi:hypothetical protein